MLPIHGARGSGLDGLALLCSQLLRSAALTVRCQCMRLATSGAWCLVHYAQTPCVLHHCSKAGPSRADARLMRLQSGIWCAPSAGPGSLAGSKMGTTITPIMCTVVCFRQAVMHCDCRWVCMFCCAASARAPSVYLVGHQPTHSRTGWTIAALNIVPIGIQQSPSSLCSRLLMHGLCACAK